MAYQSNVDYKALQDALKKQKEATADSATQAALQSQIDAAQSSKEEKIASDLTAFGKYATDSELNNAAGIQANNQLGTGYEIQKANLNTSYDNAKQNANNDALSRGMARSSFVGDRMANLDSQRANALSGVDASKAMALQNAKTSILDNYRTNTANSLANEKGEFANTVGAYYNDFQAKINEVTNDGDTTNDWQAKYLQQAKNQKIAEQEAKALEAARYADKMAAAGSGGSSGTTYGVDPKLNPFGNGSDEVNTNIDNWLSSGQSLAAISIMLKNKKDEIGADEYNAYRAALDAHRR